MWISPNRLRKLIFFMLTGNRLSRPPIIRIHNRHRHGCTGDLSFPYSIDPWRNLIEGKPEEIDAVKDILTYYKNKALDNPTSEKWDVESILIAFKRELVKNYNEFYLTDPASISSLFEFTLLTNDTVVLGFHAARLSYFVITSVLTNGIHYGHKPCLGKRFKLTIDPKDESEVTTLRLTVLKRAIRNLLKSQGFELGKGDSYDTYYLLSANDSLLEKDLDFTYEIIKCAKVLNKVTWMPETALTRDAYVKHKVKKIKEFFEQRCHEIYVDLDNIDKDIEKYANAAANHELSTVDYFEPVVLEASPTWDLSTEQAVYILYTNVRMTSILHMYSHLVISNDFPRIPDLQILGCLENAGAVASWHLIFDYILEFPDVLESTLYDNPKLIINIPFLWKFCYNLCKDFTKYYENHPIVLTGPNKTEKIVFQNTIERLYILKALRIILRNALFLLGVTEVTFMH